MNYLSNEPNPTPPTPEELAARYEAASRAGQYQYVPSPKRKRRTGRLVLVAVAAAVLGIVTVGSCSALMFDGAIGAVDDKAPVILPDLTKPLGTATPTTRPSPKAVEKAPTNNLPRDGVLIVGKDLKPGVYQGTCPEDTVVGCYWARLKDTDGQLESVLANNVTTTGGKITLRVKVTDYAVEIRGGNEWKRVG